MDEYYWVHTMCGEAFHADLVTSRELVAHMESCTYPGGKHDTNWLLETRR